MRRLFHTRLYQSLAVGFCVLFALAMILNTQMSGEANWYWYAYLLHRGIRLYADMHFALQPLLVLETDAWMRMFGIRCIVTEIPSILHALLYCGGMLLVLAESDWPDWQKAIVLAASFLISISVGAYRFDDFHVTADIFVVYSLAALLRFAHVETDGKRLSLAIWLGMLSGFTITTRLNDGAALIAATLLCLFFLTRRKTLAVACIYLLALALTWIVVVRLTGDSLSAYTSNSILRAAATKGVDKNSLLARPWEQLLDAIHILRIGGKTVLALLASVFVLGALISRYWQKGLRTLVPIQLALAVVVSACASHSRRLQLLDGWLIPPPALLLIVVSYVLAPVVLLRWLLSLRGRLNRTWDAREILVFLPLAGLASGSASTGGHVSVFLAPVSLLLLLVPVIDPLAGVRRWANPSFITVLALLAISCVAQKIQSPYAWGHYRSKPMFVDRQWFAHPVYGPLYVDRSLLEFIEPLCKLVNEGGAHPQMLSLPYSYPNYFCDIPPWHGYVQTYFDTSSRSTIEGLMAELNQSPPEWIIYQRQRLILRGAEIGYNHGQPLAHRDLDTLIMQKLASRQWLLISRTDDFVIEASSTLPDDGWYLIHTHP